MKYSQSTFADLAAQSVQGGVISTAHHLRTTLLRRIERVVFLGAAPNLPAKQLKSLTMFIVAREDSHGAVPRLPEICAQYDQAPEPKELIVLEGSAHAQFLFETDQGDRVMREIL